MNFVYTILGFIARVSLIVMTAITLTLGHKWIVISIFPTLPVISMTQMAILLSFAYVVYVALNVINNKIIFSATSKEEIIENANGFWIDYTAKLITMVIFIPVFYLFKLTFF